MLLDSLQHHAKKRSQLPPADKPPSQPCRAQAGHSGVPPEYKTDKLIFTCDLSDSLSSIHPVSLLGDFYSDWLTRYHNCLSCLPLVPANSSFSLSSRSRKAGEARHQLRYALCLYILRTANIKQRQQLCVHYSGHSQSVALSKQSPCDAVTQSYGAAGVKAPLGMQAHSTRALSSSTALFRRMTGVDICTPANCDSL